MCCRRCSPPDDIIPESLSRRPVQGSLYARSDSGWVDSELFFLWMKKLKLFVKFAVPERPILLVVDGHVSHLM